MSDIMPVNVVEIEVARLNAEGEVHEAYDLLKRETAKRKARRERDAVHNQEVHDDA